MWREFFANHILERGYQYYKDGAVLLLEQSDAIIEAEVVGTDLYDVAIYLGLDGTVDSMTCTCPYAEDGNYCKHMAAVLYAVEADGVKVKKTKKRKQGSTNSKEKQEKTEESKIAQMVNRAEEHVVRNFLATVLEQDANLADVFERILTYSETDMDLEFCKNKLHQILDEYDDEFLNYYAALDFAMDLTTFMEKDVAILLRQGSYQAVWQLTTDIFEIVSQMEMDDSAGGLQMITEACINLWDALEQQVGNGMRQRMYQWCEEWIAEAGFEYFDDVIQQFWEEHFQGDAFLPQKLDFMDAQLKRAEQMADGWQKNYQMERWLERWFDLLETADSGEEAYQVVYEHYWTQPVVRTFYVAQCLAKHAYAEAEKALKDGLILDANKPDVIYQHCLQLKNLYKITQQKENYLEVLWALNTEYPANQLDIFRELKAQYSAEEWPSVREMLFKEMPENTNMAALYKEEKLYDALLQLVLQKPGLYLLQRYERELSKQYAKELLGKYTTELQKMAQMASDRNRYRELVRELRRMQNIPGGEQAVAALVQEWRAQYKRRTAMMDELKRL